MSAQHQYHTPGVFLNHDVSVVRAAYEGVMAQGWGRTSPSDAEVARYVLRMYDRGIVDIDRLQELAALHFRNRLRLAEPA